MSTQSTVTVLPQATVQDTFPDVLNEIYNGTIIEEDIWLSCYKSGEPSVHGKIGARLHAVDRDTVELKGREGVQLGNIQHFKYRARCEKIGVDAEILLPVQTYADPIRSEAKLPHQISALDASADVSLLASAFSDGTLTVQHLPTLTLPGIPYPPRQEHKSEPVVSGRLHLSTIVAVRLLPGPSPILASAGADFRLHITSLPTLGTSATSTALQPSMSLTGHTRALTSLAILDGTQGGSGSPTLASGGKDGTVRLWDISTGTQLSVLGTRGLKVPTSMAVSGIEPHTIWAALSDGGVQAFDVRARESAHVAEPSVLDCGPLAALDTFDDGPLLLGGGRGTVAVYEPRAAHLQARWMRSGAPVEVVVALPGGRALVGGEDGLPYIATIKHDTPRLESELVFGDVEGVRSASLRGDEIWLGGDGGIVRRYAL